MVIFITFSIYKHRFNFELYYIIIFVIAAPGSKSIYIANLPQNVTKNALVDALKIFGSVRPGGVQIRMFEVCFKVL